MTGDARCVAAARLAAFVILACAERSPPEVLVEPRVLGFSSEWPEERSELVVEALVCLGAEVRTALLVTTSPFAWRYAACVAPSSPRVIAAAIGALAALREGSGDGLWAIRAFAAWAADGRAALDACPLPVAGEIAAAVAAHAAHRARARAVSAALRSAIDHAMDALDADPAAQPSRRVQLPVLAFGEPVAELGAWMATGSWANVETRAASGFAPMIKDQVRRVPRHPPPPTAHRGVDARTVKLLLALARVTLPTWEAIHPTDMRPHRLIDEAERIAGGELATPDSDLRAELYAYGYRDDAPRGASVVALLAVWAHSAAVDDGMNDVQDTPPDFAVIAFTARASTWSTRIAQTRDFWEYFLLELVPAVVG